jgi:hypothetical protein
MLRDKQWENTGKKKMRAFGTEINVSVDIPN